MAVLSGQVFAGAILIPAVRALSLASFGPISTNLTSTCEIAYNAELTGCGPSDFQQDGRCSASCINSLVAIQQLVVQDCANASQNFNMLIGTFLAGNGIPTLCHNVVVTTAPASSTATSSASLDSGPILTTCSEELHTTTTLRLTSTVPITVTRHTSSSSSFGTSTAGISTLVSSFDLSSTASSPSMSASSGPPKYSMSRTTLTFTSPNTLTTPHQMTAISSAAPSAVSSSSMDHVCEKGSNAEHQGSLLDNYCGSASILLPTGGFTWTAVWGIGIASLVWVLVSL